MTDYFQLAKEITRAAFSQRDELAAASSWPSAPARLPQKGQRIRGTRLLPGYGLAYEGTVDYIHWLTSLDEPVIYLEDGSVVLPTLGDTWEPEGDS